jgi:hypothetical protein
LDSTNIMCPSIIDKYIKRPNYLFNMVFIEFVVNYDIVNLRKKRKKSRIIHYVNIKTHKITI